MKAEKNSYSDSSADDCDTTDDNNKNPEWLDAEPISCGERCELKCYKFITWVPVIITFSIFSILVGFYIFVSTTNYIHLCHHISDTFLFKFIQCYLIPCIKGDFESTLGIQDYWANSKDRDSDMYWAQVYAGIFGFCALNLLIAIILTIITNPGSIPSDREWDIPKDIIQTDEDEKQRKLKYKLENEFINQELYEDTQDPTETLHFEYRYIKST